MQRLANRFPAGAKVSLGVDSLVTAGVIAKGRSASVALNSAWRQHIGYTLCSGLTLGLHYVPSRLNPADAPSRGRE
eukprot:5030295-Amphidinium_carterae.1